MRLLNFGLSLVALTLPLGGVVADGHHGHPHYGRHQDIAKRADGNVQLWKRVDNSRWSFYDVGLGACGRNNVASDFIVALNAAQFGGGYPGPNCFKFITMRYNGKTTRAQIMDRCPGCPWGGLDLSRGLFRFFDSESKGIIHGSWWFDGEGGGGGGGGPPPAPPTTRRTTARPTPTTTWRPPIPTRITTRINPTTILAPTTTSTSRTRTRSSSSSATGSSRPAYSADDASVSVDYSSGAASGLAVPLATGVIETEGNKPENLNNINAALVGLGCLVAGGAEAD